MRFANSEAANGVARKIQIEKLARAFAAQIGKRRALHNSKLPLGKIAIASGLFEEISASAARPGGGALERGLGFFARGRRLNAFIEDHSNIRPERKLNLGGFFRRQKMLRAVEMGTKAHAFIGHFSQFGEAEDLIAAGVREDGARPGHELMQATKLAD